MVRSPRLGFALILVAVLAIVGCSPAPTDAPPSPPATPSGSPRPASPAATPTAAALVNELPPPSTTLDVGVYTRSGFEPRIAFEVAGREWQTGQLLDGFFEIQRHPGSPFVITIQFARPDGAVGATGAVVAVATAAEALASIQANPGLEVLSSSDSRMSGFTGIVVEVENPTDSGEHVGVMRLPPGPLGIDAGRRLWIALFDTNEGLLAVMVGGPVAGWDAALLAAEPVLETVTIGG